MFYLKVFLKSSTCKYISIFAMIYLVGRFIARWDSPHVVNFPWWLELVTYLAMGSVCFSAVFIVVKVVQISIEDLRKTAKTLRQDEQTK